VARTLPWATVVILDLILAVATTALLALLVLPGIVFGVVYGLAPAIAKLDRVGVRAALTESRRRVLPSFWRVALVLAIFALSRGVVEQVLQSQHPGFIGDALIHLGVQAVGAPLAGLAVVLMAIELRRTRAG